MDRKLKLQETKTAKEKTSLHPSRLRGENIEIGNVSN